MRVACIQLNTQDDKTANLRAAAALLAKAAEAGARLAALPETWSYKGSARGISENAEDLEGPSCRAMSAAAEKHGMYVLAGSFYERTSEAGLSYNTSVLFGPDGARLAVYRKIHMFDAVSGERVYRESQYQLPGADVVTAAVDDVVAGLSICYDLRFPELYLSLALRGARVFLVPSAFTAFTGAAHWEVLVRARAIENGCFVVAPDQVGFHAGRRECHGHSMIVDPWGRILAEVERGTGICVAEVDLSLVHEARENIPSLQHRRPELYGLT